MERTDVGIVGKGIVAVEAAVLAASSPARPHVQVFYDSQSHTASVHNHGWAQSGMLYWPNQPRAAELMRLHGLRLLHQANLSSDGPFGIFRARSLKVIQAMMTAAKKLGIGSVRILDRAEAEAYLGPRFFDPREHSIRVPDGPFAEGTLMTTLFERALRLGVEFIEVPGGVQLVREHGAPNRYALVIGHKLVTPRITLLAAGIATPRLLKPLGVRPLPLRLFRSPLLSIPDDTTLRVPLLVDLEDHKMAVLRHTASRVPLRRSLVIGNRHREELDPLDPLPTSELSAKELSSLIDPLPKVVKEFVNVADEEVCKQNVCYKIERGSRRGGKTSVAPWRFAFSGYRGLVAGGAGKVTLGRYAAEELLRAAGIPLADDEGSGTPLDSRSPIKMWWEDPAQVGRGDV